MSVTQYKERCDTEDIHKLLRNILLCTSFSV